MTPLEIIVKADTNQATTGLRAVQGELGKTAAISKTASTAFSSIGSSISSLGSSLITGGILTGIILIGSALVELSSSLFEASEQQKAFNEVEAEGIKIAAKASTTVKELTLQIDLAKKGFIDKDDVVRQYNKTIGKTTGLVQNIEQAETELIKKGPAYIQFMFLKAEATYAFGKASELAVQALFVSSQKVNSGGIIGNAFDNFTGKLNKQADAFAKIAREAEQLAALVSAQNGLDFFGDNKPDKVVKVKIDKLKIKPKKVIIDKTEFERQVEREIGAIDINIPINVGIADTENRGGLIKGGGGSVADKLVSGALGDTQDVQNSAIKFQQEAGDIIRQTYINIIEDSISTISDSVANALVNNQPLLPNLFAGLMRGIGQQVKELGKYLVKTGIEMLAAKKAIKALGFTPQGAIIAGIALQLFGSVLTAAASKKFNESKFATGVRNFSGGTALVGERGPERIFLPRGSSVQPNNELGAYGGGQMVFIPELTLKGPDLVIAFNRASAQMNRNN